MGRKKNKKKDTQSNDLLDALQVLRDAQIKKRNTRRKSKSNDAFADAVQLLTDRLGDDPQRLQEMIATLRQLHEVTSPRSSLGPWDNDNPFRVESH